MMSSQTHFLLFTECSDFSPPITVILLIFLCLEGLLFFTFTAVMFGTQIHSICNDETVCFVLGRVCLILGESLSKWETLMSTAGACVLTREINWPASISPERLTVFALPVILHSAYFRDQCDLRVNRPGRFLVSRRPAPGAAE